VKDFYDFSGILSNHEGSARLSSLLAQVILGIQRRQAKQASRIVTVTRSMMTLTTRLVDEYLRGDNGNGPKCLAKSTIEELEALSRDDTVQGPAILITDVIGSGTLLDQVARALPKIEWLGAVALLDTRDPSGSGAGLGLPEELDNEIICLASNSEALSPVYSLAFQRVDKTNPSDARGYPVTAIDRVNVCPVAPPKVLDPKRVIWPFLETTPKALHVCGWV